MAKCLVLGADGFIGSHLTEALSNAGHSVRAFDRLNDGVATKIPEGLVNVELFPGNFLNRHDLDNALKGIDYVFHLISTTTPATSASDPFIDIDTNIRMSVELFQLAVEHGVKRVIFPSTGGAIYGQNVERSLNESDATEPVSPYAIGKLAIEGYLRYFHYVHGLDYLSFRVSNPYGERQNVIGTQGVIPIFLNLVMKNKPLTIFGDGSMVRDYIYITDLTAMMVNIFDKSTNHSTYNLGSGHGLSVNKVIEVMRSVTKDPIEVTFVPMRPTDVHHVLLDISLYNEEFGKLVLIEPFDGIEKTWKYVKTLEQGAV